MHHVKKKPFVFFFYLLFLLGTASLSYAIGISPADAYVNFVPNHEYIIDYSVTGYRDFEFYTEGPFSEYTRIDTKYQSDRQGLFRVHLILPEEYDKPGKHRMYVAAKETPTAGAVNTIAGIRGFIEIDVPYPGYYAELQIGVDDVNVGEPVYININVLNKGKLNITDAKLHLTVFSDDLSVKTIESDSFSMEVHGGYAFQTTIPGGELKPGTYQLRVRLEYEGTPQEETVEFRVGTFDVAITNYTDTMHNNSLNLFEIEIESLWNNLIKTVWMDLRIKNGSKILSTVKTPPFDLSPWEKRKTSFYWNTAGVPVGEYELEIVLHYGDNVKTDNRKIFIVEKQLPEQETPIPVSTVILVIVAIMLVIFNIYFIMRGRRDKDEKKEKEAKEGKTGKKPG
jgi:hypothetical protein